MAYASIAPIKPIHENINKAYHSARNYSCLYKMIFFRLNAKIQSGAFRYSGLYGEDNTCQSVRRPVYRTVDPRH